MSYMLDQHCWLLMLDNQMFTQFVLLEGVYIIIIIIIYW